MPATYHWRRDSEASQATFSNATLSKPSVSPASVWAADAKSTKALPNGPVAGREPANSRVLLVIGTAAWSKRRGAAQGPQFLAAYQPTSKPRETPCRNAPWPYAKAVPLVVVSVKSSWFAARATPSTQISV